MDILFLSNVLPFPLDAGPKLRSYYVLRYLAQSHRVTLLAHTRASDTQAALDHMRSFCHAVVPVPIRRSRARDAAFMLTSFARAKSFLILRDDLPEMRAAIASVTAKQHFDAVHADQLSTAHYALQVSNTQHVLDQHNAVWTIVERLARNETLIPKRWVMEREAQLLKQHEAAMGQTFDRVITVTAQDRQALEFPDAPTRAPMLTIPICIDTSETPALARHPHPKHIACVGGMFYPPNADGVLWFAREILPRIWAEFPDTKFFVVGTRPTAELVQLGERDARIVVTGYVQDTTPILQETAAFVVPLRAGGGMRVKILDAWARALPIVTTTIGCEGISVRQEENALIADTPDEFARAVMRLRRERALGEQIARAGRAWVQANYDWRTVYRAFDAVYPHSARK